MDDDKIAWYENIDGNGTFGLQQVITTEADGVLSIYATDIDGDGDQDILSASKDNDKIAWYENTDGNENFTAKILIQPINQNICPNSNTNFFITTQDAETFQWQENQGNEFVTITDNSTYSGTVTENLEITNAQIVMNTYQYRCIISNTSGSITSNEVILTVEDNTNPVIVCVGNQTVTADNTHFYIVQSTEFDPTETSDNCGIASVENDFNNSSTLAVAQIPEGTETITWTITDNFNNSETCSLDITVNTYVDIKTLQKNDTSIYPNPMNDILNFDFADNNIQKLTISDITGKK